MIVRTKRNTNFTIISNIGMEDDRLTFKAKGILAYLLSKPDDWQVRDRQLATVGPDGRAAVQAALSELEKYGYIKRVRERNEQGQWTYTSYVYDEPRSDYPATDKPWSDNPSTGKPATGKPAAGNRAIISTVVTSTDLPNTDLPSTEEKECSSADADAPPTEAADNFDAIFGNGTTSFDPPADAVKAKLPDWDIPLSEMPPHQAMFAAVLDAIGWDRKTLSERDKGQVAQACKTLRDAEYEYHDVGDFMERVWFRDWRWTEKGSRPTLNQLRQEIGKVRAGIPVEMPRRQTSGGDAVDAFFDRLEREGYAE